MANKQIKDFDLKESIDGLEDLLIQDSDGITKRIKTSNLMGNLDLSNYYTKAEVDDLLADTDLSIDMADYYDKATIDNLLAKKANVSHTHSYNNLTDKPSIPSINGLATKKELTDGLATKSDATHNHDKVYALKTDIPTVPTKTSQLTNDSGFIKSIPSEYITETELSAKSYATETFVTNKIAEASLSGGEVDLSGLATKAELATKADKTAIPTKTSQLTNDSGFLTEHQDLSDYALKTELPTVPTKVSQLANDSGFIKSIPSEYVTETELNAKGYLTEHQDISGKVDKVKGKGLSTNDLTTELKSNYDAAYTHSQSAHFSGSYDDLKNKPTIPKAYVLPQATDSTLGGVKVGAGLKISEGTLSLGSHTHTIANVDGLQAELNKKANTADLKTVATSGSYNDLTNKPTIPTSLPANGGNADTVNNIHIVVLTQEDYDGLEVKDETTLYIIKG